MPTRVDHAPLGGATRDATGSCSPAGTRSGLARRRIAVALHDIEPATFHRCALIRDWLDDHGVDRVTLLVIPARDLHPLGDRSPQMTSWLAERRRAGDSIAQYGFHHQQLRPGIVSGLALARPRGRGSAEFVGLDSEEARRAVAAGWRVLKLAGIEPDGFVAPGYAYTPALRHALGTLTRKFRWWAGLLKLHVTYSAADGDCRQLLVPAWGTARHGAPWRVLSPALIRAGSLICGRTMRLDLHPADLQHPRQMMALEWVLGRAGHRREAITYDELLALGVHC